MSNQAKGIIRVLNETQVVSDRFQKRTFVLELDGNPAYPQLVEFELTQERTVFPELYKFGVGDVVEVAFNLKGRKWTSPDGVDKYFNTVEAWSIKKRDSPVSPPPPAAITEQPEPVAEGAEDDLPF